MTPPMRILPFDNPYGVCSGLTRGRWLTALLGCVAILSIGCPARSNDVISADERTVGPGRGDPSAVVCDEEAQPSQTWLTSFMPLVDEAVDVRGVVRGAV